MTSTNGGNHKLFDRDNSDAIIIRYFAGMEAVKEFTWTFDFIKPVHCLDTAQCNYDMLYVGADVTKTVIQDFYFKCCHNPIINFIQYFNVKIIRYFFSIMRI